MHVILTSQGISRMFASRELQLIQEVSMARIVTLLVVGAVLCVVGLAGIVTLLFSVGIHPDFVAMSAYFPFIAMVMSFKYWVRSAQHVADRVF